MYPSVILLTGNLINDIARIYLMIKVDKLYHYINGFQDLIFCHEILWPARAEELIQPSGDWFWLEINYRTVLKIISHRFLEGIDGLKLLNVYLVKSDFGLTLFLGNISNDWQFEFLALISLNHTHSP